MLIFQKLYSKKPYNHLCYDVMITKI